MPTPRQPVPALALPTLDHGPFDITTPTPQHGTVICF
jgi:hypothetical protein